MSAEPFSPRPVRERPVPVHALTEPHPVLARVLAARGLHTDAERPLALAHLAPFGQLGQLDAAANLLEAHRDGRVLVVGDFDADGATSTALVLRCLHAFGFAAADFLVPNRFEFGYGLTPELVEVASERDPSLIVTVDNGISSHAGAAAARARGIDVLVTDHHLAPETLPPANVIVNPNLPGDPYPGKALAGVGVAFAVMVALGRRQQDPAAARWPLRWLDLVALGTVADVVPLDRNNRILIAAGLERIRSGQGSPGIDALLEVAGRDRHRADAGTLGFAVAPRLNAAGRLEDMAVGIRCLMADSVAGARPLAAELHSINATRRELQANMQREALEDVTDLVETGTGRRCVVVHRPEWHQGVVGLVAAQVKERLHCPVFAFAGDGDGALKGSGRSVPGVHLRDVLAEIDRSQPGMITRFGGHAMAAGLTLPTRALASFETAAEAAIDRLVPGFEFTAEWLVDGGLEPGDLTLSFAHQLAALGPWGQQFPEPLFSGVFELVSARVVGERHLRMMLRHAAGEVAAIAFGQVRDPLPTAGERLHLVFRLQTNEWRGQESVQLLVEQWQPEEP